MNYRLLSTMLAITCATASISASAETLFRPRASIGYSSYELAFTGTGNALSSISYLKGGIGATIATGQLYFDAGYSGSLGAKYDDGVMPDQDFLREDLTLTVGYALANHITVFGGYKAGTTEYTAFDEPNTTLKFEATGPYFGAGISIPTDSGVWSLNGAIAILSATLKDDTTGFVPYDASADSVGFSLGAGYTIPFGGTQGLSFKASYQSYDYTGWTDPVYTILDTTETLVALDVEYYVNF